MNSRGAVHLVLLRYQIANKTSTFKKKNNNFTDILYLYYYEDLSSVFWEKLLLSREFPLASLIMCFRKTSSVSFCLLPHQKSLSHALLFCSMNVSLLWGYRVPCTGDKDEEDSCGFKEIHEFALRACSMNNYRQFKYYNQISLFSLSGLQCTTFSCHILFHCF